MGTLNVFEAAKQHQISRIVYASSGAVFGTQSGAVPYPMTQYGAFKLACEQQDFVYVEDAAAAFIAAALTDYDGAHVFSLTGGTSDVRDVIDAIKYVIPQASISSDGPTVPMASVIAETPYDQLLGPMPRTSLKTGIEKTIAYYKKQLLP